MALAVLLFLGLFWSLVYKILYCQTFPFVSFMGQTLANHSYVDLSLVGDDPSGSDSVQCITDLSPCCSGTDGPYRGDWYFHGTRLPFLTSLRDVVLREFIYVVGTMLPHQLVSIAVIFQLLLSMIILTSQ